MLCVGWGQQGLRGISSSTTGLTTLDYNINSCLAFVLSPQVYPNSPGVQVSSPHKLVTFAAQHPDKVRRTKDHCVQFGKNTGRATTLHTYISPA